MSKSILTLQVPPRPAPPRGAFALGACTGTLCVALRDLGRALCVALHRPAERRHA